VGPSNPQSARKVLISFFHLRLRVRQIAAQALLSRFGRNATPVRPAEDFYEPSIKFELIVTKDDDLIAEVSISRNFQNDVRAISIAGRRGQLDELEAAIQRVIPDAKLRKSETDLAVDGEYLDTEKLIQVLFALMPPKFFALLEKEATSKVFAYSQKTRCLKLFQRIVEGRQDGANEAIAICSTWQAPPGSSTRSGKLTRTSAGRGCGPSSGRMARSRTCLMASYFRS
jgi:hypothetical protein